MLRSRMCCWYVLVLILAVAPLQSCVNVSLVGGIVEVNINTLPLTQIQDTIGIQGTTEHNTLDLPVSRSDIGDVTGPVGQGVTFNSAFEINGDIFFEALPGGQAFMNADIPVTESEADPFISALLSNGLVPEAFHQHFPMHPQIWFVHFRGTGDPIALATSIRAAIGVTGTPLPQSPPSNPTTPLDAAALANTLHGTASVGDQGVVTVWVLRRDLITIDGVQVNPQANVSTNVQFMPLGGSNAAVVADFSMTTAETVPVVDLMLDGLGWYSGCLYNQETGETPQLYFDHMLKQGDALTLAAEIRRGLDLTDSE